MNAHTQATALMAFAEAVKRPSQSLMSAAHSNIEGFIADMQKRVSAIGGAWHDDDTLDLSDELAACEDALAALKLRIECPEDV